MNPTILFLGNLGMPEVIIILALLFIFPAVVLVSYRWFFLWCFKIDKILANQKKIAAFLEKLTENKE